MNDKSKVHVINNLKEETNAKYNVNEIKDKINEITSDDEENIGWKKRVNLLITKDKISWKNVLIHSIMTVLGVYCIFKYPYIERYKTFLFAYLTSIFTMFGVCAAAHRYWSHRSFKANLPFRIILATCYLMTMQIPLSMWIKFHRLHHKYTDTDFDPHNSRRGFFYCHIGWLLIQRPKIVRDKLKMIDMSDIKSDTMVGLMDRYFPLLTLLVQFTLITIPVMLWNESWYYSAMAQYIRFFYCLQLSCCGNSVAHLWGYKPYDKKVSATDNTSFNFATHGEGWHNYHHTFPSDYRTPEFDTRYDLISIVIDFFGKIGWAYDFNQPSEKLAKMVINNRGDVNFVKALASN